MNKAINKINLILATTLLIGFLVAVLFPNSVLADEDDECDPQYGGGEICNKSFDIEKWVRRKGSDDKKEKLNVEEDEEFEFLIRVTNTGQVTKDDMKMEDILPGSLERIGGHGLTEEWDDFAPGETIEFTIKVKVEDDEFDRDGEFDKCVVNIARVLFDGHEEGSDDATVCWGDEEVEELPETGANLSPALSVVALLAIAAGALVKKNSNLISR